MDEQWIGEQHLKWLEGYTVMASQMAWHLARTFGYEVYLY